MSRVIPAGIQLSTMQMINEYRIHHADPIKQALMQNSESQISPTESVPTHFELLMKPVLSDDEWTLVKRVEVDDAIKSGDVWFSHTVENELDTLQLEHSGIVVLARPIFSQE